MTARHRANQITLESLFESTCFARLHLDGALVQSRLAGDAHKEIVSKRPEAGHRPHMVKVGTVLCTPMRCRLELSKMLAVHSGC